MSRSQKFVFTWNNYTEADEQYIRTIEGVRYCCYGREVAPTTGTPHLQGFIFFQNARWFDSVTKLLRCHIEVAKTTDEAIEYCKKTPDWVEWGDPPVSRKRKGEKEVERWEVALKKARVGEWKSVPADIYIRYKKTLETPIHAEAREVVDRDVLENYWFWGPTGCGKSKLARERWPDAYHKDPKERWWDGYKGQEVVIIDDFDIYQKAQGGDMKRWADHYVFPAPIKGAYINIRPKVVVVTSNYSPEEIWEDEQTREPILRRFKVERMGPLAKPFVENFKL